MLTQIQYRNRAKSHNFELEGVAKAQSRQVKTLMYIEVGVGFIFSALTLKTTAFIYLYNYNVLSSIH